MQDIKAKVLSAIKNSDGKIFSVTFVKRTTGEIRAMTCRLGVTKHLKGGDKAYDPKDYDLVTVFDMQKQGYRSIPIDAILDLKIKGEEIV